MNTIVFMTLVRVNHVDLFENISFGGTDGFLYDYSPTVIVHFAHILILKCLFSFLVSSLKVSILAL